MLARGPILVTGATGRQGGAVIRHLLVRGAAPRALTRDPTTPRARQLAGRGVELARGDMDDPDSLKEAMAGAYGVYSVQDFWTVGARREVQQGKNVADAALAVGIEHLVFSSVGEPSETPASTTGTQSGISSSTSAGSGFRRR